MRVSVAAAVVAVAASLSTAAVAVGGPQESERALARPSEVAHFWEGLLTGGREHRDIPATWIAAARGIVGSRAQVTPIAASDRPSNGRLERYTVSRKFGFAGDLNGDRRSDVVDIAQTRRKYELGGPVHHRYDITAYEGRSGGRLWTARVTPPEMTCVYDDCKYLYRDAYAFPASLEKGPGIELAVFSVINDGPKVTFDPNDPRTWRRWGYLFAVDLATVDHRGRQVWARHIQGRLDVDGHLVTLDRVPIFQDIGHTESGKVDDWLFTVSDGQLIDNELTRLNVANTLRPLGLSPYVPNGDLFSSQAVAVDGRTGKLRNIGNSVFGLTAVRYLTAVGDLSGDGRDDIVETHPYSKDDIYTNNNAAGDGLVTAIRSSDGARLWQQLPSPSAPTRAWPVGDVTGDSKADVVLSLSSPEDTTPPVVLLDGATGAVKWQKAADWVLPVGDIRRNRHDNVLLAAIDRNTRRTVHVAAYDAAGGRLWAADAKVPATGAAEVVAAMGYEAGDLDGDRLTDTDVSVRTVTRTTSGSTTQITVQDLGIAFVSARTGRLLPRAPGEDPIFGSLDGRGDDGYTRYATGVIVRAGDTAKPLWQVNFGRRIRHGSVATDGTQGHCGSLLTAGYFENDGADDTAVVAVFERSNKLLWTRTFGRPVDARPRTVAKTFRC